MEAIKVALLLAQMKANQWKSRDELESIQETRLRSLIDYAASNVPCYKKHLKDSSIKDLEDLAQLPLTDKEDIRAYDQFISDKYNITSLRRLSTSGSTGMPLTLFHHSSEAHIGPALELHQLTEAGIGPFEEQVQLFYQKGKQRLIQRLGIFRRHYLSMYADEKVNLLTLKRMDPQALIAIPSSLIPLAHTNSISSMDFTVEKIFSFSEMLTKQARDLITGTFCCDLYDMYGTMETSWIAWQCEKGTLHLHSDSVIAEIVDEAGFPLKKGEYGNLILTPLWQRAMPFIRYNIGDQSAFGPKCSCGRGLHTLKSIEGREHDLIVLKSGRLCSASFVNLSIRSTKGILFFQMVQDEPGVLHIRLVPEGKSLSAQLKEQLVKRMKAAFPEPVRITLEEVDQVERTRSGKIKLMISKIKPDILH
jgi:phenylacetate-CoA ligase